MDYKTADGHLYTYSISSQALVPTTNYSPPYDSEEFFKTPFAF